MTLDPTVAAAIVTEAGGLAKVLLQKLLEVAGQSPPDNETARVVSVTAHLGVSGRHRWGLW
jgi:hypothetical protein